MVALVADELGLDPGRVRPSSRLDADLAVDSLGLVLLLLRVEEETGGQWVLETFPAVATVQDLGDLAISHLEEKTQP